MRIAAALSRRYEPDELVEEMKENLSWCDEIIIYDDRDRDPEDLRWLEHERYTELHRRAGNLGVDYVLATAPDERWSHRAEGVIRQAIADDETNELFFATPVLELYTPTAYRKDGAWSTHFQVRIYPWKEDQVFSNEPIHNFCTPVHDAEKAKYIYAVQYHLKHLKRESVLNRVKSFEAADPTGEYSLNGLGYGYLADETNLFLEEIPEEEMYYPIYTGDYTFDPFKAAQ